MFFSRVTLALAALTSIIAHPLQAVNPSSEVLQRAELVQRTNHLQAPDLEWLFEGNKQFRENIAANDPTLLGELVEEGQSPPFMFLGCSDSRVSEGTIFNAKPGTFFSQRNIANQFHNTDSNAQSVLAYAVTELGVKHVIVMGHYGCGGVAAAIASPPPPSVDAAGAAVQNWIDPIRELFETSSRPEIVELRERLKGTVAEEPDIREPGFRALVEENVKVGVRRMASDSIISNHYALVSAHEANSTVKRDDHGSEQVIDVFIHGWVYDLENGNIKDLGVSVGPPGKPIPPNPFAVHTEASSEPTPPQNATGHENATREELEKRCLTLCKTKRNPLVRAVL